MPLNAKTGLQETWHDHYGVPIVHQRGLGSLRLNGQVSAVHTVPLGGRLTLDFFSQLRKSDELIVTLPGSVPVARMSEPYFARVATFRASEPAFIAFADPTIGLDSSQEMRLAWFLGAPDFDPAPILMQAIRRALGRTSAKHVAFVGGSGGGFSALRMSAMLPGSMAYLHEGTTNIAESVPSSVSRYFETAWPGWDQGQLLHAFPDRFDMVRYYQRHRPQNFVYFAQSEGDTRFRTTQYGPFRSAMGVNEEAGVTKDGARHFVLYGGEVAGHGKVTQAEFRHHFRTAMRAWREFRTR